MEKKVYQKPQMVVVNIKANTQLLNTSEQYNMCIIKGTKGSTELDLQYGGAGHGHGRSRGTDDWDWEEW